MRKFKGLDFSTGRQSEISEEELPEDDKDDFFNPDDTWDDDYEDDEPEEREYCD